MANISFYQATYKISDEESAFSKFMSLVQNYYDANFYVDWNKVFRLVHKHEREFALLSTLCGKSDKILAARELIEAYPQIIPALPVLIACRDTVSLVSDPQNAMVETFYFKTPSNQPSNQQLDEYSRFLGSSGIVQLLERIKNVGDYVTGVEVGMDTNARKNRGGTCGVKAIDPWILSAANKISGLKLKSEATYDYLISEGFTLPDFCRGLKWDFAFWKEGMKDKLVVMEVNHYGSSGSKPPAIAREYMAREKMLKEAGIGFIWITDGLGWHDMRNPLKEAFISMDYVINIKLAADGLVEHALANYF